MHVLVTGASGFVGRALVRYLNQQGFCVRAAVRDVDRAPQEAAEAVSIPDVGPDTNWSSALDGIQAVVHLAARAHRPSPRVVTGSSAGEGSRDFHLINELGTRSLAMAAKSAGIERFIYLSTVGVYGAITKPGQVITEASPIAPDDAYASSKLRGEQAVRDSGVNFSILRAPLIYGHGAPGNLDTLCRAISSGRRLPLARANGQRSMLAVTNLCSLIARCIVAPSASGKVFLVADEKPIPTAGLVRDLARYMGRPARLFPLPPSVALALLTVSGKRRMYDRLFGSLVVDGAAACRELDWHPPHAPEEDLRAMAQAYVQQRV